MKKLVTVLDRCLHDSAYLRRNFTKIEPKAPDNRKRVSRLYEGRCYLLSFTFSCSGSAPGVRNMLECRLLTHRDSFLPLPLSRVLSFGGDRYIHTDYPFIATADQMERAILELLAILEENSSYLTSFFCSGPQKELFFKELLGEIHRDCGEEPFVYSNGHCFVKEDYDPRYLSRMLFIWFGMRKSARLTEPFCHFYKDRPDLALEGLASCSDKDGELLRMLDLPAEKIVFSSLQKELYLLSRRPNRLTVLPYLLLSMVGCSLLLGPLLAGLCYLVYLFAAGAFSEDLLYHTSLGGEQYAFLILPAFAAGILWLCFDNRPLFFLLYNKRIYKDYAAALSSSLERTVIGGLGCVILSLLLVFSFLQGNYGVRFEKERFTDHSGYFQTEGEHYLYRQIKEAAFIKKRPVGPSEKPTEYASVILVLEDGKILDLYDFATASGAENKILPLLKEQQVPITQYETLEEFYKIHPKEESK